MTEYEQKSLELLGQIAERLEKIEGNVGWAVNRMRAQEEAMRQLSRSMPKPPKFGV